MVDVLSITALVISVVALVTTILQVLQQFFGSAEGYRRCAKSVMGKWSNGTHRVFRGFELRFEVTFETPVIFLSPPTNRKGPIPGRPIYYIDGTTQSYEDTRTVQEKEENKQTLDNIKRVHTADDERASWVSILSTLQTLENESRGWESANMITARGKKYEKPAYTMSVALQRKTRSWDFMPAAVYKPFATTTICHLVEMVTMLGMYWKTFEESSWNMRAEGNGYILNSIFVPGLGIMVTFSKTGSSRFQENRYIPSDHIKELAFGSVPSIFGDKPALKLLTFGNKEEVNHTLQQLGCLPDAIARYGEKRTHIFPLAFEIIGMLAVPIRFRGSNFKMVPNPTTDHFLAHNFSRCKLMSAFQSKLSSLISQLTNTSTPPAETADRDSDVTSAEKTDKNIIQLTEIVNQWEKMAEFYPNVSSDSDNPDAKIDIDFRESIHDAIKQSTELLADKPFDSVRSVISAHISTVLKHLDTEKLDTKVQGIFNRRSREEILLTVYFNEILPIVVSKGAEEGEEDTTAGPDAEMKIERYAIWCTLVFRMICWLLLHDFDKIDVKIAPSALKGSRMPVYIG